MEDKSSSGERTRGIIFIFRCPNIGLKVQGWVADGPTESKGETYQSIACTICKRRRLGGHQGLGRTRRPRAIGRADQWNRRIPTSNGIAPKGNGSLQCCLANLQRWLRRVPVPRHPDTPGVALTQGTNPQAAPRLGVLLYGLSVPMQSSSASHRHSSIGAIAKH